MVEKILIIRLSSFGDIVQSLVVLEGMKERFPKSEIHWLVRSDFKGLVENHPLIDKVYDIPKGGNFKQLLDLSREIKNEKYDRIYDAHNNTRSNILSLLLFFQRFFTKMKWLQRPKFRWKRLLLFKFKINLFPWPFVLMKSYLEPLKSWGIPKKLSNEKHLYLSKNAIDKADLETSNLKDYIVMAPSAAWELKRWPTENWTKLVNLLTDQDIVFLGGPGDDFIQKIIDDAKNHQAKCLNFAGKLSYEESCSVIENAAAIVGGDSGLTHVGDSFGIPTFCIIGAAAFAYPARASTIILDHKLPCKPCSKDGRGECTNNQYKACLYGITPEMIKEKIRLELLLES